MSSLKVYNTTTRKKEEFVPLKAPDVKMYVCGPTVYNFLHVGNFRGVVFFNFVRRWLEKQHGYKVTYALNFTDVDDKIIRAAQEQKIEALKLSENYIQEYKKDFSSLGLQSHDLNPKVSESMDEIISLVQQLVDNQIAYVSGNDVLFSIEKFKPYGKLSGRNTEELLAGARVEVDEKKRNPLDFALWKGAKPGEPSWTSPWGNGRPGWHIECSAMIHKHLGEQIDIHGGGMDLIFPHHENEIAQSEGCTGKEFSKYWIHHQMMNFSGQKMSKSLGNFVTLRDFLKTYHPELYKWMILSVHYRSICEFGEEAIHRSISGLARIYSALAVAESFGAEFGITQATTDANFDKSMAEAWKKIEESLNDDFGTPEAFAVVFEVIRVFNSQLKRGMKKNPAVQGKAQSFVNFVQKVGDPMALFQQKPSQFLMELDNLLLTQLKIERSQVEALVQERAQARSQKNFPRSDELRAQLEKMGISVSDTVDGSFWEVTK